MLHAPTSFRTTNHPLLTSPFLRAQDAQSSSEKHAGTAPRASADKYQAHADQDGLSIGAELLTKKQAADTFAADVNHCCLIVHVAVFPKKGEPIDLSFTDFTLVEIKTDAPYRPENPTVIAAKLEKRKSSGGGGADVTETAGVGYESGTYTDPITGQQVHVRGVSTAAGVGIAAGTPLAVLGAIGRAAQQGSIIKGGIYLEALGRLNTVFLDKTGTLTYGMPLVSEVTVIPGVSEQVMLQAAASAESGSEHPLGRAIVRFVEGQNIPVIHPDHFEYRIGRGVLASLQGEQTVVGNRTLLEELGISLPLGANVSQGTEVLVSQGGRYLGSILVTDRLRDSSVPAVKALADMGIQVALLTGDTESVARAVADRLGILEVHADLLPEQKTAFVAEQVKKGKTVAMLGDGINDAPALSEATVGVAMGAGTDVARESADIVLIGNDLMKFVETVRIARNCRRIIFQNFYGTLIVDTIGISLAAVSFLNPLLAAFIHVASELTFIVNSTRLLAPRQKETVFEMEAPQSRVDRTSAIAENS